MILDIKAQTWNRSFPVFVNFHWDSMTPNPSGQPAKGPKLMDEMRVVLRLHHYAIRTERAYCEWVRRYVKFHEMKSRGELAEGKVKVEARYEH